MTIGPDRDRAAAILPRSRLRSYFSSGVTTALGEDPGALGEYTAPVGDRGLFGPESIPWIVHADLPAMLIGGFSALMFQTLHPLAMAGVAEHSRFRADPLGRLKRTARFIAGTTFGPTSVAQGRIDEVLRVHQRVHGVADDDRPYDANDPDLLTFVHTTEMWSFLRAYERFGPRRLAMGEKDRYLAEVAVIAYRLGAKTVPENVHEVWAYFAGVNAQLFATPEAISTVGFLRQPVTERPLDRLGHRVLTKAAIDLLPGFAREKLSLARVPVASRLVTNVSGEALSHLLRWSVGPSAVAALARERVGAR